MKKIYIASGILIIPLLWLATSRLVGSYIVPGPWKTVYETAVLLGTSDAWDTIFTTVGRVCVGFALAFLAGGVAGIASVNPTVDYLLRPLILLMQGIPPILWSIPLILIMGWSGLTPVVVIALICFPLVATTLAEGMQAVPVQLREMLDIFAPGFSPRLKELIIPHLRPYISAAVRLGFGLGIKASVVAEYFAANNGIGFEVQTAYQAFMVRVLFSWALVLVVLILLTDMLVRLVFRLAAAFPGPRKRIPERPTISTDVIRSSVHTLPERQGIILRGVSFSYPDGNEVFAGIDLVVEPEEIAVVSGDSGIGKTTFLKIIAGLIQPAGGYVQSPASLGFMFQDDRFLPWSNCVTNTALGLYYRDYSWAQSRDYARFFMEQVGLAGKELSLPDELSGGMKKRLSFARSISSLPGALLLDEPFTGLHHEARAELWLRFSALISLRPLPVIVATHFPGEVPTESRTSFYELSGHPARLERR